jgi:hypothetical protein
MSISHCPTDHRGVWEIGIDVLRICPRLDIEEMLLMKDLKGVNVWYSMRLLGMSIDNMYEPSPGNAAESLPLWLLLDAAMDLMTLAQP